MSKFVDKLKHLSDGSPQSMGFRPRQPASPKPKMQLMANIAPENLGGLADFTAIADAVLLTLTSQTAWEKVASKSTENLWGARLSETGLNVRDLIEKGCDFVVFPAQIPTGAIEGGEAGKILTIDASLGDGLLRALNELPVDAVFVVTGPEEGGYLSWERLLLFQRCSNLVAKPLIVSVSVNVTGSDLQALWTAGIDCVVIEAATPENIKKVRQTIDSLTFPLPRRREKAGALLPHIAHEAHHVVEEEEE